MSKFIVQDPAALESAFGGEAKPAAPRKGSSVDAFVRENAPLAQKVGERLGVEPHVLLGQWGLETGWGKSVIPGTNNLGNIKDFKGKGPQAKDNMTGSVDAYRAYDSLDAFADDFAGLLERKYTKAIGSGADARSYFNELKRGGYAEDPAYVSSGTRAAEMARAALGTMPSTKSSGTNYQFLDPVEPTKPRTMAEAAKDVALGGAAGVVQGAGMLAGAFGADNPVAQGAKDLAGDLLEGQSDERKAQRAARGQAIADAETTGSTWEEIKANLGMLADAPVETIINAVGTSAPTILTMFIPGLGQANAARLVLQGAMGAAQGAGAVKGSIYEAVERKLIEEGETTDTAAKVASAAQAYDGKNGGQIAAGAIFGAAAGTLGLERSIGAMVGKGAGSGAKTRAGRAVTGALGEAPTEGAQGGQERIATNIALQNEGFDVPTFQGAAGQAAGEAAVGAVVGGGFGAASPARPEMVKAKEAAAEPNSPLSRAAVAGNPDGMPPAGGDPAAQDAQDPITARAAAIEAEVREGNLLEKLREIGQPGRTTTEFLDALAVARNPQADPRTRQQAIESLDMAMGWIRDGKMPGDPANGSPFSTELTTTPAPRETSTELSTPAATDVAPAGEPEFFDADTFDVNATRVDNMVGGPRAVEAERQGLPGPRAIGMDEPADVSTNPPETNTSAEPVQETEESAQVDADSEPEPEQAAQPALAAGRRPVPLPKVAIPEGAAPAFQRQEAAQIEAAVKRGFDTVERRGDGVYLVNPKTNQESKLSGLGAMARARQIVRRTLDAAASQAASSPLNDLANPTEAQAKAGNYKKGSAKLNGFDISIENPVGSTRSGTAKDGTKWETTMGSHYGYFKGTEGADGDQVDVFIGPRPDLDTVFVVDQIDPETGMFDEHKVMMGYPNIEAARAGYLANYDKDWKGLQAITEMPLATFRNWVKSREARKPAAMYDQRSEGDADGQRDDAGAAGRELGGEPQTSQRPDGGNVADGQGRQAGPREPEDAGAAAGSGRTPAQPGAAAAGWVGRDLAAEGAAIDLLASRLGDPGIRRPNERDPRAKAANSLLDAFAVLTGFRGIAVDWTGEATADGVEMDGDLFVNIDQPQQALSWTIGHEFKHVSDRSKAAAALYQRIWDLMPQSARAEYIKYLNRTGQTSTADITLATPKDMAKLQDEMVADFMGQRFNDKAWLTKLAKQKPALFGEFVRDWLRILDSIAGYLRGMMGVRGGRGNASKDVDALLAGYVAQLEEAKAIAMEVAVEWAKANPRLADRSGISPEGVVYSAREDDMEFPSFDENFFEAELQAQLQAELEAEMRGANPSIDDEPLDPKEIKGAGLQAEDAMGDLYWESGEGGWTMRARIPDLYSRGKVALIDMEQNERSGRWSVNMNKTWVGPTTNEPEGFASLQGAKDFARRFVASYALRKQDFDLLSAVSKPEVRRVTEGWKTLAKLDKEGVRRYGSVDPKAKTIKEIADAMGLTEDYKLKVHNDTTDPTTNTYNMEFEHRQTGVFHSASFTIQQNGQRKTLSASTVMLNRSGMGAAIYQLGAEFAVRRGIPLSPESSISGVNTYRRTEQMLSAALRTGKSNAMVPHPTQRVYGFNDKASTQAEHDDNIARLALANLRGVRELAPEVDELTFSPETGTFFFLDGEDAEGLISEILSRPDSRTFGLGRAQLSRAALTREMMDGQLKAEDVTSFAQPVLYSAREEAGIEYQAVRDQHLGKSTWMMAPNGRPTKLSERQWIQVRTPSFKKWFGDWEAFATQQGGVWNDEKGEVSKAVEPDTGEPMVVYHGTTAGGFYKFKETGGQKRGDLGIFTTPNYDMARSYVRRGRPQDMSPPATRQELEDAGFQFEENESGTINLIDVDGYVNDEFPTLEEALAQAARTYAGESNTPGIYAAFVNQRQVNEEDFQGASWNGDWVGMDKFEVYDGEGDVAYTPTGEQYMPRDEAEALARKIGGTFEPASPLPFSTDDVVREARSMKYSGAIIRNVVDDGGGGGPYIDEPSDVHVVFDPGNIKSADFNTGEFGDSDDIRFSSRNQDPAIGDRTDVARLPMGVAIPESAAAGSLEKAFAMASGKSYARGRDLKIELQTTVVRAAKAAGVDLTARTQELHQFLANMVVADAKYAMKSNANAVGWYDSKVSRAVGALAQVHPEIESDQEARLAFLWALAVTSNGLKVAQNFDLAERAYRIWSATGTMPDNIGIGNAAQQINKGLRMHKDLVEKMGAERLMKFMSTELEVGQIARMLGTKPGGEWMGTPVRGASILGPKIGNGFFSNLNGYFGALTMDRWLMRTWGRMTGTLMEVDAADVGSKQRSVIDAVNNLSDAERRAMTALVGRPVRKGMTRAEADQVAIAVQKASIKPDRRAQMQTSEALDALRKAGNNLQRALDGQKEAPANPGERNWIRAVFSAALAKLQGDGLGMTMSDLQALLWYPERRLYDAAKADDSVEEGYADDEAPDYANAALKLAIDAGKNPVDVLKAMDAAEKRGTVKGDPLSPTELEAMLSEFRSSPAQQVQLAFEVAPDPAETMLVQEWNVLPEKARREITQAVYKQVMPDIAELSGVPLAKTVAATGGFAGHINPNVLAEYQKTKVTIEEARATAALIGFVLDQDSVALIDPRAEYENGLVRVTFSGKIDSKVGEIFSAIRAEVPEVDAFTLRGQNFDILNFTGLPDAELESKVRDALDALDIGDVTYVSSFGKSRSELIEKASYEGRIQGLRPGTGQELRTGAQWIRDRARQAVAEGVRAAQARDAAGAGRAAAARLGERPADGGRPVNFAAEDWNNDIRFSAREVAGTESFRKWFGDSAVVDALGAPLVVYTGTSKDVDFASFKIPKNGAWFTVNPMVASTYALDNDSMDIKTEDYRTFTKVNTASRVMPVFLRIEKPYTLTEEESDRMNKADNYKRVQGEIFSKAKAAGFDGVDLGGGTFVVIGEPAQIKSAIGNNGNFNPAKKDILLSAREAPATNAFQRWFQGSKVVHADGSPLVVYHGTSGDFTEFAAGGTFFTSDAAMAATYGRALMPAYLSIRNPADDSDAMDAARAAGWDRGALEDEEARIVLTDPKVQEKLKNAGFDGWIGYDEASDETGNGDGDLYPTYFVFDPEQIKSATGNDGGFDPSNPDIRFSAREPSKKPSKQTDSEAFKKWFGTPGVDSTMVNEDGSPMRLFHGTTKAAARQIGVFRRSKYGAMGPAVYLGDSRESSAGYEDGAMMEVYARGKYLSNMEWTKYVNEHGWKGAEAAATADGYAGVYDAMFESAIAVWDPANIKSATDNNGAFDGGNPDIRFSARSAWDMPEPTRFDDFVYKSQDKLIDLKRVIQSITKSVGAVAEDINAYLQEELFHGRSAKRAADFGSDELEPMIKKMAAEGLTIGDVEEYLHARHAREANQVIADRNPGVPEMQDGGSGMTNADADAYMAALTPELQRKLEAVAADVDAIVDRTRQLYVEYGLETQDTVDSWKSLFKNYIPLQREEKEGATGGMGIGQGFSVKGKETKGRTGSKRKVVDILGNIAQQRERLIVRGEKNRVAMALVGLAGHNPNPDFWSVGPPPAERVYDPKTNTVVERVDPMYRMRANVLVAKMPYPGGEIREIGVVFNEENPRALRLATALKNLDAGNLEGVLGVSAKITRYFSAINTQYNPVFGVVNLVRDVQGALINLGGTPLADRRARIAKDTFSALSGIYRDVRATRRGGQASSAWAALWEEFQTEGGQTGFRELFRTGKDRADALQRILTPDGWADTPAGKVFTAGGTLKVPMSQARKGAAWIFNWLSDYNDALENGVRLAAYKSALDKGMTKKEAASLAKNLTVNFNRRGQLGMQAGAVYAFFNAAMQGSARMGQLLFDMDGGNLKTLRLSKSGKKVVYGGMMLGSIQALTLAAAGFDEEDPPAWQRERNIIIPTGGKTYIAIPMPLGLHVIPGIGRSFTEFALSGFEKPAERAIGLVGMFADSFNPIGNAGMSMQTLAPTVLDPFVALTENRDYTGRPIARTSMNDAIPGHTLHKDTASTMAKLISEAINTATGGNDYVAGAMSPTPDQIDYLIGQVTGGVGRELSKVEQTSLALARGEDLPTYKIPLAGRFVGNAASQSSEGTAFYANTRKLNELETEVKGLRGDGKVAEAQALLSSRPDAYLIGVANAAERQVQRLRKEKRDLLEKGATRAQIREVELRVTEAMSRLNRAAERLESAERVAN